MASLRSEMLALLDELRTIAPSQDLDLYRYRTVKLRRRVWSGVRPGDGSATDYDLPLVNHESDGTEQPVRCRVVSSREVADSGGTLTQGDFTIGPITPRCYRADLARWVGYFPDCLLGTPTTPTIAQQGTAGVTTWRYRIYGVREPDPEDQDVAGGCTELSAIATTTTGNATLSATNYNRLTLPVISGVRWYVYRVSYNLAVSPLTTGLIGSTTSTTFDDTGLAGDSTLPFPPALDIEPGADVNDVCLVLVGDEGTSECTLVEKRFDRAFRYMLTGRAIAPPLRG